MTDVFVFPLLLQNLTSDCIRFSVCKFVNNTFTSCQSIIITVTYGPGTLTWYFYMKNWVWYQNNQLNELIPMVPFTPNCQILTNLGTFSDPSEIFDLRNNFFFFNKPLQNLGSIWLVNLGSFFDLWRKKGQIVRLSLIV